jgi:hypothetical protein
MVSFTQILVSLPIAIPLAVAHSVRARQVSVVISRRLELRYLKFQLFFFQEVYLVPVLSETIVLPAVATVSTTAATGALPLYVALAREHAKKDSTRN